MLLFNQSQTMPPQYAIVHASSDCAVAQNATSKLQRKYPKDRDTK